MTATNLDAMRIKVIDWKTLLAKNNPKVLPTSPNKTEE